jgi:hypothetical protein
MATGGQITNVISSPVNTLYRSEALKVPHLNFQEDEVKTKRKYRTVPGKEERENEKAARSQWVGFSGIYCNFRNVSPDNLCVL